MNRKGLRGFNLFMFVLLILGITIGFFGRAFKTSLSEFMYGFITGISIVFIVAGLIYIMWRFSKRENPFKAKD